ncbi:MAG: vanadium-dependent haloperoxidase [Chthoniobacterales bacterium]
MLGVQSFAQTGDSFQSALGQRFSSDKHAEPPKIHPNPNTDTLHRWNQIAIDASGVDHTPVAPGENRVFGEQLGPCRAARAMAIVHIAMADSVAALRNEFGSYTGVKATARPVSMDIAIAQAAHDTLVALFPSQAATFDGFLNEDLLCEHNRKEMSNGRDLGRRAAAAILAMRAHDGAELTWSATAPFNEPKVGTDHPTSPLAGHWRQDPISLIPLALGAHWGQCTPFVLTSSSQFRAPAPPAMNSPAYTIAYNEVKTVGGDGVHTPSTRTAEQTFLATFWAYDGTPSLCAPPRLYNQIAVQIADQKHLEVGHMAHLLALVNVAMAEAGFSAWESKYYWDFWRPITGIRESDPGTGPTGSGDGNPNTTGDPGFMPLGAPASNLMGPNFTPPFPAYPSGHATFGGALFQTLRRYFKTDRIPFTFVSDEFNGKTKDNTGTVRPYMPRYFSNLSQAEQENGQSRIFLGIHWAFDKTEGIAEGRKVADYVFDHAFQKK